MWHDRLWVMRIHALYNDYWALLYEDHLKTKKGKAPSTIWKNGRDKKYDPKKDGDGKVYDDLWVVMDIATGHEVVRGCLNDCLRACQKYDKYLVTIRMAMGSRDKGKMDNWRIKDKMTLIKRLLK